jgi:hypothetical protein
MAAKTKEIKDEILEEEDEKEEAGNFRGDEDDSLTVVVPPKKPKYNGPRVEVFLPEIPHEDGENVDQYEHVTLANEKGEEHYRVLRGERVEVPVPVFIQLHNRYGGKM